MGKTIRTVAEITAALAAGEAVTAAEQIRVDEHHASQIVTPVVTPEGIVENIAAAIGSLGLAFYQPENRILGDNGRAYSATAFMPSGVEDTGQTVTVNAYAYLQKQIAGVVCWKLEQMLQKATDQINAQRKQIAQKVRQLGDGRTDEAQIERMADYLESLIEQREMVSLAFEAALPAYEAATDEQFETAAMRAEREQAVRRTLRKPTVMNDRLRSLGVAG